MKVAHSVSTIIVVFNEELGRGVIDCSGKESKKQANHFLCTK